MEPSSSAQEIGHSEMLYKFMSLLNTFPFLCVNWWIKFEMSTILRTSITDHFSNNSLVCSQPFKKVFFST